MRAFHGSALLAVLAAALVHLGARPVVAQSASELSEQVREFVSVDAPVVALTNATVIDGTGAPAREGQTIVIEGGRIAAVGASDSVRAPDGAEVIDLSGQTVIPGLVGLHDHIFYTAAGGRQAQLNFSGPRLYLGSGVTTVRTTGSMSPYADISLKRSIDAGRVPGPRIHITAPYITGAGDSGTSGMALIDSPGAARRFVEYWAEEGATWIKAYTDISRENLRAAIEAAHELGLKVTGHLCSVSFQEAVDLGIDNLEHGFLTNSDFLSGKEPDICPSNSMIRIGREGDPTGEVAQATIEKMVEHGVSMTSTMAVIEPFIPSRPTEDDRTLDAMAPEIREAYLDTRARFREAGPDFPFTEEFLKKEMAFEREFVKGGGLLAAGVDPTGIGGALHGFGDQRNVELLVEAGFTAEEAVQICTANGARILGVDQELGTVEAGKAADLVVLDGDLASDISVIRNVTIVFKDGVGYDSPALIESVQGLVGVR